jgi:3-oxoacyl-[acyl-carrier protein] reductase
VRRPLVLGGTGHVGEAVLRGLRERGLDAVFTWHGDGERARALAGELDHRAVECDVRDSARLRAVVDFAPDVVVHCAAVADHGALEELGDERWDEVMAVNARSAFVIAREAAPRMTAGGDLVFCASLDGLQAVPSPAHFAASQGALAGLTRALSKELGPRGIRVNLVMMGVLDGGIARALDPARRRDYEKFAALGRVGTAAEAARAILAVALDNEFMTGAILPITGGL